MRRPCRVDGERCYANDAANDAANADATLCCLLKPERKTESPRHTLSTIRHSCVASSSCWRLLMSGSITKWSRISNEGGKSASVVPDDGKTRKGCWAGIGTGTKVTEALCVQSQPPIGRERAPRRSDTSQTPIGAQRHRDRTPCCEADRLLSGGVLLRASTSGQCKNERLGCARRQQSPHRRFLQAMCIAWSHGGCVEVRGTNGFMPDGKTGRHRLVASRHPTWIVGVLTSPPLTWRNVKLNGRKRATQTIATVEERKGA